MFQCNLKTTTVLINFIVLTCYKCPISVIIDNMLYFMLYKLSFYLMSQMYLFRLSFKYEVYVSFCEAFWLSSPCQTSILKNLFDTTMSVLILDLGLMIISKLFFIPCKFCNLNFGRNVSWSHQFLLFEPIGSQ